jgi:hypothetical protein
MPAVIAVIWGLIENQGAGKKGFLASSDHSKYNTSGSIHPSANRLDAPA